MTDDDVIYCKREKKDFPASTFVLCGTARAHDTGDGMHYPSGRWVDEGGSLPGVRGPRPTPDRSTKA